MILLSESIGSYSQIIKINDGNEKSEVTVRIDNEVLYNGVATHIVDEGNVLNFKDDKGEKRRYIKYNTYTIG